MQHRDGTYLPSQRHQPTNRRQNRDLLQIPLTSRDPLLANSAPTASSSTSPPTSADSATASPFNWLDLDRADAKPAPGEDLYFAIAADELHALSPPAAMPTSEELEKLSSAGAAAGQQPEGEVAAEPPREYKTYKRRWFGLLQLVLLNIIVSWDVGNSWERGFAVCSLGGRSG
jgi:hypothetical protein